MSASVARKGASALCSALKLGSEHSAFSRVTAVSTSPPPFFPIAIASGNARAQSSFSATVSGRLSATENADGQPPPPRQTLALDAPRGPYQPSWRPEHTSSGRRPVGSAGSSSFSSKALASQKIKRHRHSHVACPSLARPEPPARKPLRTPDQGPPSLGGVAQACRAGGRGGSQPLRLALAPSCHSRRQRGAGNRRRRRR